MQQHVARTKSYIILTPFSSANVWNCAIPRGVYDFISRKFDQQHGFKKRRSQGKELHIRDMMYRQDADRKVAVFKNRTLECSVLSDKCVLCVTSEQHRLSYSTFPCTLDSHDEYLFDRTTIQVNQNIRLVLETRTYEEDGFECCKVAIVDSTGGDDADVSETAKQLALDIVKEIKQRNG